MAANRSRTSIRVPAARTAGAGARPPRRIRRAGAQPCATSARETDFQPRHRGDGGQSLAAKAQRGDIGQVAVGNFEVAWRWMHSARSAASMPQPSSMMRMSLWPPPSMVTSMRGRPGVERVFEQFLDGGARPLDHLAGGDAVGQNRNRERRMVIRFRRLTVSGQPFPAFPTIATSMRPSSISLWRRGARLPASPPPLPQSGRSRSPASETLALQLLEMSRRSWSRCRSAGHRSR